MDKQRLLELAGALEENIATHSKEYQYIRQAQNHVDQYNMASDNDEAIHHVAEAVQELIHYIEETMEGHL